MNFPKDLKYTKDHEWVRYQNGVATVGITEFAQSELGELVFVDLPAAGKQITKGAAVCVVESTKAASDVYAPIGGKVKEVNQALTENPTLVNTAPYTDGWMVRLEGVNDKEIGGLMSAEEYGKLVGG